MHALVSAPATADTAAAPGSTDARTGRTKPAPARAGLVVGRTVGNSVVRSRISRRLRHLLAARLPAMPAGTRLVVRAGSAAAGAPSTALAADLDAALARVLGPPRPSRLPRPVRR